MQKAELELKLQEANIQLVQIRQAEIDYFTTYFFAFSIQCGLIISCCVQGYTSIEQTQVQEGYTPTFSNYMASFKVYWILTAFTMGFAIQCLLMTVFIVVYAPGLALRGGPGSMEKAVLGMRIEQTTILWVYTATMCSFTLMTLASYWVSMLDECALPATIISACFFVYTSQTCLRVYNRFYYEIVDVFTNTADDGKNEKALSVNISGFLSIKVNGDLTSGSSWERHFFALRATSLSYYKAKADFEKNSDPVNLRPIDVTLYHINRATDNENQAVLHLSARTSHMRSWILRPDDDNDIKAWEVALEDASRR